MPSKLETLMIERCCSAPFRAVAKYRFRSRNRVPIIMLVKFVSTICWISSGVVFANKLLCVIPAQFTSTEMVCFSSLVSEVLFSDAPMPELLQNEALEMSPAM